MSEAGSIGVIAVLMNVSKVYKKMGYEITVFRGGKYKALGNPYEALSSTAKKIYQAKIDTMESFFLDAVAENRGIPRNKVKAQVGEGLTFFAEEAVSNGLMDEVLSFDDLFGRLISANSSSSAGKKVLTEEIDMKKKVLTEESVAALAAGASEEEVTELFEEQSEESAEEGADEGSEEQSEESNDSEESAEESADEDDEESAEENSDGGDEESAKESSLVVFLKDEVKSLRVENSELSKKVEAGEVATANEVALKSIAGKFIASMCVPLGITPMKLEDMDTSVLLSQYTDIRAKFTANFKVGGVAEVQEGEPESSGEGVSPLQRAAAKANDI